MDPEVEKIIRKENGEVLRGILLDLVEMDYKNEERILILYHKYG